MTLQTQTLPYLDPSLSVADRVAVDVRGLDDVGIHAAGPAGLQRGAVDHRQTRGMAPLLELPRPGHVVPPVMPVGPEQDGLEAPEA